MYFRAGIDQLLNDILNPEQEVVKVAEVDAAELQADLEAQLARENCDELVKQASELAALKLLSIVDALSAASQK
jgi:predicted secreted Zn-dependent protease